MDFGSGVSALVPTAILVAPQASFEGTPIEALSVDIVPEHWRPTGDDRSTRLAAVVLAWNVFQHFYPYFDVMEVNWETTLPRSLVAAAIDEGEVDFIDTLKRLVTDLRSRPGRTEKGHRCACREDSRLSTHVSIRTTRWLGTRYPFKATPSFPTGTGRPLAPPRGPR